MKKSFLAITHQKVAAQWHPTKNGDLTPDDVTAGSGKKVWWQCEVADDHEWQAALYSRTGSRKDGCPACSGKKRVLSNCLATIHPELAKQWHPTKNEGLTPFNVTAGCNKKIWWQCEREHEWQAIIANRKKGQNCPFCGNNSPYAGA